MGKGCFQTLVPTALRRGNAGTNHGGGSASRQKIMDASDGGLNGKAALTNWLFIQRRLHSSLWSP